MGIEDEDTHTDNLDRMTQFINEGNAKTKCIRDLEYNVREKRKYREEATMSKKEAKLKKQKRLFCC